MENIKHEYLAKESVKEVHVMFGIRWDGAVYTVNSLDNNSSPKGTAQCLQLLDGMFLKSIVTDERQNQDTIMNVSD